MESKYSHILDKYFGDELDKKIISNLNESEKILLEKGIEDLLREDKSEKSSSSLMDILWERDYVRKPPSMEEFITDDYWIGSMLRYDPEFGSGIYPAWREKLVRDFNLGSRVHNLVITGSLGTGKTWIMVIILLYKITLVRLLKHPAQFFGLSKDSPIVFSLLSVTKSQVKDTAFGYALSFMSNSPFFRDVCGISPKKKYSSLVVDLGNGVMLAAGSKGQHVLGRNTIGVGLDEGNFRLESNPDEEAYNLYNEVRVRIRNRFLKRPGFLPAITIIVSSATDESSFTEKVVKEINSANDSKRQLVYRDAVYNINRSMITPETRWFRVAYGLKNIEPVVLRGFYTQDRKLLTDEDEVEDPPKGSQIEYVPEDYIEDYTRNTRVALQSMSGISVGGSNRLFPSMVDVERCIELSEEEGLENPALKGVTIIPLSSEDEYNLWDFIDHSKIVTRVNSTNRPIRHPNSLRFAHVDLATVSKAGLAVAHIVGKRKINTLVVDGKPFSEYRIVIEYDFILTLTAGKVKPINYEKIFKFFFWLRNKCGYRFGKITGDQFQSEMPMQMLESGGFEVGKLSMDRAKDQYYSWRTGFNEMRIRAYRTDEWYDEAERLINGDRKVDHPPGGSKDTTDAMAGAYYNAITSGDMPDAETPDVSGLLDNSQKSVNSLGDLMGMIETLSPGKKPKIFRA